MLEKLKKDFVKILSDDLLLSNISKMLDDYHRSKVEEIIVKNTDIYSVFHYDQTKLLGKVDGVTYCAVRDMMTGKSAVINSNKEIIIPFDDFPTYLAFFELTEDKNIHYTWVDILFDLKGNVIKNAEEYNRIKSATVNTDKYR